MVNSSASDVEPGDPDADKRRLVVQSSAEARLSATTEVASGPASMPRMSIICKRYADLTLDGDYRQVAIDRDQLCQLVRGDILEGRHNAHGKSEQLLDVDHAEVRLAESVHGRLRMRRRCHSNFKERRDREA